MFHINIPGLKCVADNHNDDDETVRIKYTILTMARKGLPAPYSRQKLINEFKVMVKEKKIPWIKPGYHETVVDLNLMKTSFRELKSLDWLRGKVSVAAEFEIKNLDAEHDARMGYFRSVNPSGHYPQFSRHIDRWQAVLFFTLLPELVDNQPHLMEIPVEIHNSLQRFKKDFPESNKVAFLVMRFKETRVHIEIGEAISECLKRHGIDAVRADEKYYHDDLYHNILTYMHGCGFGIAVFERIEEEMFNPNISLEVGYMLALQKPICILKDRTLKTLHTDLMGKLYKIFDPLNAGETLDAALTDWLCDKALI